jgi:hypothetical protein
MIDVVLLSNLRAIGQLLPPCWPVRRRDEFSLQACELIRRSSGFEAVCSHHCSPSAPTLVVQSSFVLARLAMAMVEMELGELLDLIAFQIFLARCYHCKMYGPSCTSFIY